MKQIAVMTDSVAALLPEIIGRYSIQVVPILLGWGDQIYRDGVDITPGEVYRHLRRGGNLTYLATPSMGDFIRVYSRLALDEKVAGIASVLVSSKLSSTCQEAQLAIKEAGLSIPVRVVDTSSAGMAEGFAVLAAARAAEKGADLEEVVYQAEYVSRRVHTIFVLKTLEYLLGTGRAGRKAMRMATSALNVKPIVCLDGGKVGFLGMPRVWNKALSLMLQAMQKQVGDHPVHAAVMHADAPDEAERLRQQIADRFNCLELLTTEFSPVMGGSAGPGSVGVAFYCEDNITGETKSNLEEV